MRQLTLSGTRKKNTTDFVRGTDDYSRVINALWRLEWVGTDRKSFQKVAQLKWKSDYKGKPGRISELLSSCEVMQIVEVNRPFIHEVGDLHRNENSTPGKDTGADKVKVKDLKEKEPNPSAWVPSLQPVQVNQACSSLESFLGQLGVDSSKLLTQDVVVQGDLMENLKLMASVHIRYKNAKESYLSLKQRERHGSGIRTAMNDIDEYCQTLTQQLNDIADISINLASILQHDGIRSAVLKREKIVIALTSMVSGIKLFRDATRRVEVRVCQMRETKEWGKGKAQGVQLDCVNSMELTWVDAVDSLIRNNDCDGPLTAEEVLRCGVVIEQTNAMPLTELLICSETKTMPTGAYLEREIIKQLLYYLPLMSVRQDKTVVLVNVHELCLEANGKTFVDILNLDKADDGVTESGTAQHSGQSTPVNSSSYSTGQKVGRRPLHEKHPEIVQTTMAFLQQHSFAAQERRRSSVSNASGVTLADIRDHLLQTVPGLTETGISRTTVQRLFYPPHKGHNSAKLYKRLVNARVPAKQNTRRSCQHIDTHYCRAQVNHCMEFTAKFNDQATAFSCDDKNKVNVGESTPAVSRYHHIGKFFMTGDSPNYCDHDFPLQNSKLIPSGYMELKQKDKVRVGRQSRSVSPKRYATSDDRSTRSRSVSLPRCRVESASQFRTDRMGRLHYNWPRTGPTTIVNRATKFHGSSMAQHVRDLRPLIAKTKKPVVTLILDNGPDQSTKSQKNITMLGRLWRDTKIDVLQVCHYAPGDSALNPIEHQWSPRSRDLAGVYLKARLDGEEKPPSGQRGLSKEQIREKEVKVYDRAIDNLNSYWNDTVFDGFPVTSIGVYADCESDKAAMNRVEQLHSAGVRKVTTELKDLHQEHLFLNRHLDRRLHVLSFTKCKAKTCLHCSMNPVQATSAVAYLREHSGIFSPLPSPWEQGHFCTFLETEMLSKLGKTVKSDEHCPTNKRDGMGRCEFGCKYMFSSKTNKSRHQMMCHYTRKETRTENMCDVDRKVICHFVTEDGECGLTFTTRYQLSKHQDQLGHKVKRGRRAQV